jgi:putative transposase
LTTPSISGIVDLEVFFMPRAARIKSKSGIYHIMMRGINRHCIFKDEDDCLKFIRTIQDYKEKSGYEVYAYCLMGNHVHILLKVIKEPLEQVMRRICGRYVYWYNQKYNRIGSLFQDRFKSEPVEDDTYFLTVIRYIHQNPIKAGLVLRLEDYKWSSFNEYIKDTKFVDVDFALNIFNSNIEKARKLFIEYNKEKTDDVCMDIEEKRRITDKEAAKIVKEICKVEDISEIQKFDISKRNGYLKQLKKDYGLSIRQIERVTGINRGVIQKAR